MCAMPESDWKNYYKSHGLLQDPQIMAIIARDEEAKKIAYTSLSKRQKDKLRGKWYGEWRQMERGDRESKIFQSIDKENAKMQKSIEKLRDNLRRKRKRERLPDPKFKNGQSVLQWWAQWMKSAKEPPKKYGGKKGFARPAWYSGDVLAFQEYGTILYAGVQVKDNLYRVH